MKPDWAERKARKLFDKYNYRRGYLIPLAAAAFRAERRRAVRVCKKMKDRHAPLVVANKYQDTYWKACDDCARAIHGK